LLRVRTRLVMTRGAAMKAETTMKVRVRLIYALRSAGLILAMNSKTSCSVIPRRRP
jgi:hypothetical protein